MLDGLGLCIASQSDECHNEKDEALTKSAKHRCLRDAAATDSVDGGGEGAVRKKDTPRSRIARRLLFFGLRSWTGGERQERRKEARQARRARRGEGDGEEGEKTKKVEEWEGSGQRLTLCNSL